MLDERKLQILTEGAKYDVSCSSSGSRRKNSKDGLGNAHFSGICHSFTPDGRCISLLKLLMSNDCVFDCKYCPNRHSADVERATLTPEEICELTIGFYRRNYIEGLFLSSAVYQNANATMELLYQTVYLLRTKYRFNGYIHLKGIPHADEELSKKAGFYVDRMSYNVELPAEKSLKLLAPQKTKESIFIPMGMLAQQKEIYVQEKLKQGGRVALNGVFSQAERAKIKGVERFLPAGQTTQMIVGASPEKDGQILRLSQGLYRKFDLKRVYFSAYIPVVDDPLLPTKTTGLLREHRLYQADWLMRFYGFDAEEISPIDEDLPLEYDPKCAWALKNMQHFPIEIQTASVEQLLRVPGIGAKGAYKIVSARKYTKLTFDDLKKMRIVLKRAKHFITCSGKFYGAKTVENAKLQLLLAERSDSAEQMSLFSGGLAEKYVPNTLATEATLRLKESVKANEKIVLHSTPATALSVLTGEI